MDRTRARGSTDAIRCRVVGRAIHTRLTRTADTILGVKRAIISFWSQGVNTYPNEPKRRLGDYTAY